MKKPNLEIADIFHKFGHLLGNLPKDHKKVVQDILNCRTSVLGGHKLKCGNCDLEKNSYNSCRSRHCPKCQFLTKAKWIEKRSQDLLPCQYFHVVFTIWSELRPLFLRNKKVCYNLLFKAASETLKEVAENPKNLGAEIGFIGVLHTWSQSLINHYHIHFIVPGGGLNKEQTKWIPCRKDYFLPIKKLSAVFKGKMLNYLRKAYDKGEFEFSGKLEHFNSNNVFSSFLADLAKKDPVIYAKKPFSGPEQVINYLGQYTHRIAISNYRLIKIEGEKVHFKCRDREDPSKSKVLILNVREFMRRFLLHVLPKGYMRIRHFGILGNRLRKQKIEIIRKLNGILEFIQEGLQKSWEELLEKFTGIDIKKCPSCKIGRLYEFAEMKGILNTS